MCYLYFSYNGLIPKPSPAAELETALLILSRLYIYLFQHWCILKPTLLSYRQLKKLRIPSINLGLKLLNFTLLSLLFQRWFNQTLHSWQLKNSPYSQHVRPVIFQKDGSVLTRSLQLEACNVTAPITDKGYSLSKYIYIYIPCYIDHRTTIIELHIYISLYQLLFVYICIYFIFFKINIYYPNMPLINVDLINTYPLTMVGRVHVHSPVSTHRCSP